MQEFIKNAYAIKEGYDFFSRLDKESLLELYTELDYVYDLFESLGIVSIYHKNEILKDFEVTSDGLTSNIKYIQVGNKRAIISIDRIIDELYSMFTKDKK